MTVKNAAANRAGATRCMLGFVFMGFLQLKVRIGKRTTQDGRARRDAAQGIVTERAAASGERHNAALAAGHIVFIEHIGAAAISAARLDILPEQFSGSEHGIPPIWKVSPAA